VSKKGDYYGIRNHESVFFRRKRKRPLGLGVYETISRFFIRLSTASPDPGLCARRVARIKLGLVVHSRLYIDPPEMIGLPLRCPACPHPYQVEKQARRRLPAILRCTRQRGCSLRHQRFAARSQPGLSRQWPGIEQRSPVAITLG